MSALPSVAVPDGTCKWSKAEFAAPCWFEHCKMFHNNWIATKITLFLLLCFHQRIIRARTRTNKLEHQSQWHSRIAELFRMSTNWNTHLHSAHEPSRTQLCNGIFCRSWRGCPRAKISQMLRTMNDAPIISVCQGLQIIPVGDWAILYSISCSVSQWPGTVLGVLVLV